MAPSVPGGGHARVAGPHRLRAWRHYLAQECLQPYQQGSAKVALTRWLELRPNCLQALLWLGRVHSTLMDYPPAIAVYERALQLDPESDEARLKLAEILVHTQKAKEALP